MEIFVKILCFMASGIALCYPFELLKNVWGGKFIAASISLILGGFMVFFWVAEGFSIAISFGAVFGFPMFVLSVVIDTVKAIFTQPR